MLRKIKKAIKNPKRAIRLAWNTLTRKSFAGHCIVCDNSTIFYKMGNALRETFICKICDSFSRSRHLAKILCDIFSIKEPYSLKRLATSFPSLKIYEAQAGGAIHDTLKVLKGYVCSEYFPNVSPGTLSKDGIRCEDIQKLSFKENSFDVVITQDVLEHIRNPELAWKEIYRVLKPSGCHVFTVPCSQDNKTVRRVELDGDKDIFVLPKRFHGDAVRDGLVYTEFGDDLIEYLGALGFSTKIFWNDDIDSSRYHIYQSYVFVSRKT